MNTRYTPLRLLIIMVLGLTSCQPQHRTPESPTPIVRQEEARSADDYRNVVPGVLIVKLTPEALKQVSATPRSAQTNLLRSDATPLSAVLQEIGATSMTPYFVTTEAARARHHRTGLDRWMIVRFADNRNTPLVAELLHGTEGLEYVELAYATSAPDHSTIPIYEPTAPITTPYTTALPATVMPANDPLLPQQWHYHNDGSISDLAVRGADINLFGAWHSTMGDRRVTVCVVDGGIDPTHEDLRDNFDLDRSFNFILDSQGNYKGARNIYPDADGHGTHVAGTIAAVSNNGIGVAGIAGGDGTPGSGVVLISAQVFGQVGEYTYGSSAGIPYGADMGAVISQNSWGYRFPGPKYLPKYDKEAIDYFIQYAGHDPQTGALLPDTPMDGGIVIFAAGNDNVDSPSWPGAYDRCISVSSMAWDFTAAPYTNRGDWISIMAPGGDYNRFPTIGAVLSTLPGNRYGYMNGTSMACPHVSGVAALVLSKHGSPQLRADELRQILLRSVRPYDINVYNRAQAGRLGIGYIDAALALEQDGGVAPEPTVLEAHATHYTTAALQWSVSADRDATSGRAHHYQIYISDTPLTAATNLQDLPVDIVAYGEDTEIGDHMEAVRHQLKDGTKYYIGITAHDIYGHASAPYFTDVTLPLNSAPTAAPGTQLSDLYRFSNRSTLRLQIPIHDPDGHKWRIHAKRGDTTGATVQREGDQLLVQIAPIGPLATPQQLTIVLTDEHGKEGEIQIPYIIDRYQAPRALRQIQQASVAIGGAPMSIPLAPLFESATEQRSYRAQVRDRSIATAAVDSDGTTLTITPHRVGLTTVTLTITDEMGESASATIELSVVPSGDHLFALIDTTSGGESLRILFAKEVTEAEVVITSLRGGVMRHTTVTPLATGEATISLQGLHPASYYLTIAAQGKRQRILFIKHP